jgi:hypothetical protein
MTCRQKSKKTYHFEAALCLGGLMIAAISLFAVFMHGIVFGLGLTIISFLAEGLDRIACALEQRGGSATFQPAEQPVTDGLPEQ